MKFLKNKTLLFSLIIILLICLCTGSYFIIISIKREVSIASFDKSVTLSFGKQNIGKIIPDYYYGATSFTARNDEILNIVKNSEDVLLSISENGAEIFLLAHKGYFFRIVFFDDSRVSIRNEFGSLYTDITRQLRFPFPKNVAVHFNISAAGMSNFVTWEELVLAKDFDSLVSLYEKLNGPYLREINYEDKTISLNCSLIYVAYEPEGGKINKDMGIKIICNDEGMDFEMEHFSDEE
ncbi:MAG: hypothetical protein LBF12_04420 [Christensenellaceae bacterium]|jgi:hypothetical protein|nr:hypothetical protein [Christensenellaceae bacterium]